METVDLLLDRQRERGKRKKQTRKRNKKDLYRAIAHCRIIRGACFPVRNAFPADRYGGKSTRRDSFSSSRRPRRFSFRIFLLHPRTRRSVIPNNSSDAMKTSVAERLDLPRDRWRSLTGVGRKTQVQLSRRQSVPVRRSILPP